MKRKLSFMLIFPALLLMLSNCGSDESYPTLTGVTLATDQDVIYKNNGSDIQIRIKIPSENYVPNLADISFVTTNYSLTSSANTIEGGVLPESQTDIKVVGITPYKNEKGEEIAGEWLVSLRWNESNISIGVLEGYLSIHHTPTVWYEEEATVNTSELKIINLPEPVIANYNLNVPYAQTYKMKKLDGSTILNGAYVFVPKTDMMKEAEAMNVSWIKSIKVQILQDEYKSFFVIGNPAINPDYGMFVIPIEEKFNTLSVDKYPLAVPIRVVIEDAVGNEVTHDDVLRFGLGEVSIPAAESDLEFNGGEEKKVNIAPYLAKIGFTREFCSRYPQMAFFTGISGFTIEHGKRFDEPPLGLVIEVEEDELDNYIKTGVFNVLILDFGMDKTNNDYQSYGTLVIGANNFSCPEEMDRLLINSVLTFEIIVK